MKKLWRSLAYNYGEGGLGQILRKIAFRLREWSWSEAVWLVYRVDVTDYRREPRLPLAGCELGFDALYRTGYFKARAFPETTRARIDSGERCHGFFLGEELVNIAWTTRDHLVLEAGLSIEERECVGIFDCYTVPAHRSRGIYVDSLVRLLRQAGEQGVTAALIAVDTGNHASIKGIERAGFAPMSRVTRRRRLGRRSIGRSGFEPLYPAPGPG